MNKTINHNEMLDVATRLLELAREYVSSNSFLDFKGLNDAVTDFDYYMQEQLRSALNLLEPDMPILSEEEIFACESKGSWIIDPLDGTSNYIQGLGPIAFVAAKVQGPEVLASFVVDASSGDIYTAVRGSGAQLNGEAFPRNPTKINLIGVSTGYLNRGGKIPKGMNARILGSQALHLCLVARGVLFGCVNYEAKAWDDVAGSLILSEAGGAYKNRFEGEDWVDLALDGMSLVSSASYQAFDIDEIATLMGDINDG